jgi:hypothetical protein
MYKTQEIKERWKPFQDDPLRLAGAHRAWNDLAGLSDDEDCEDYAGRLQAVLAEMDAALLAYEEVGK